MIEKNKKIAEFLNFEIQNAGKFILPDALLKDTLYAELRYENELEFDSNWNWLMFLIEKIETKQFNTKIIKENVNIDRIKTFTISIKNIYVLDKGWSFVVLANVSTLCIDIINSHNENFRTKKECMFEACVKLIEFLKNHENC